MFETGSRRRSRPHAPQATSGCSRLSQQRDRDTSRASHDEWNNVRSRLAEVKGGNQVTLSRYEQIWLKSIALDLAAKRFNLVDEFPNVLKLPVNRCVANIRNFIQCVEAFHHANTDCASWNLVIVRMLKLLDDLFHGPLEGVVADRTLLAGLDHPAQKLLPIEWFMSSVPLDHTQIAAFNFFVCREPILTCQTFATPTNCRTSLRRARVNNLVFKVSAFRASHLCVAIGIPTTTYSGHVCRNYKAKFWRR